MKYWPQGTLSPNLAVLTSIAQAQVNCRILAPNEHVVNALGDVYPHAANLWYYVVSGKGHATIADQTVKLRAGTLILIEATEQYEICNPSDIPLQVITIHVPTAIEPPLALHPQDSLHSP